MGPLSLASEPLPAADWDILFAAVLERVRELIGVVPQPASATLVDCVTALEQLQLSLALERRHRDQTR